MLFFIFFFLLPLVHCQTIKQLNEIIIKEELPIGSIVTPLIDKIPNLEQSVEYDLVTPLSSELDLFSIDHIRHTLTIKKRLDYETICSKQPSCSLSISIAVSNHDTIDVYILPIQLKNIDDNPLRFPVNRTVIEINENDEHWSMKTYSLPTAIDADGEKITYALYLQNWTRADGLFVFDEQNFVLKPLRAFDREEENLYSLRFVARNEHEEEISMDILVLIKDQNDNPPRCPNHPMLFTIDTIQSISIFHLNIIDVDQGENSRLEYQFIESVSGFHIDRDRGEVIFDPMKWIRGGNSSTLSIQVTDHGQPVRLSTVCFIDYQLTSLLDIHFQFNPIIHIESIDTPIGQMKFVDKQTQRSCMDCVIRLQSSWNDLLNWNETTRELMVNFQSKILVRILANRSIREERLPVMVEITVSDRINPAIISRKNVSLMLNFNKEIFFYKTKILFLQIPESRVFNGSIPLPIIAHPCLNNLSNTWQLIDSSNTFDLTAQFDLVLNKSPLKHLKEYYQLFLRTNESNSCSIELRLFIVKAYSLATVYPYFPQAFYILTSGNLSSFTLPTLPSHVKYISSNVNDITIEQANGSLMIQSSRLYSTYAYDFQIQAIDSQTPSLSCTIPVRLFFGMNEQPVRLFDNQTERVLEEFVYQIHAYDPDLLMLNHGNLSLSPMIEYEIDSEDDVEIERYTGRISFKNVNRSKYDFIVTMMDFGQPNRLITRQRFTFDIKSIRTIHRQEVSMIISRTLMFTIAGIFVILISIALIVIVFNACSLRSSNKKSLANLSPTTPDCRLIDNEYMSNTTSTSLPRVIIREQRIYPTMSNDHIPPLPTYPSEKITIQKDYQPSLSINDINKYLERFEKIYNNSSDQHFREPVGSVV